MSGVTYTVRVLKVEKRVNAGGAVTSYRVAWMVNTQRHKRSFRTAGQADAFRSELMTAARRGEPFGLETGLPVSWARRRLAMGWYEFAVAYVAAKWPQASPNHRRGIAEALTDATDVLVTSAAGPALEDRRAALRWSFSFQIRDRQSTPTELSRTIRWLEANTVRLDAFQDRSSGAALARAILSRISRTKDGRPAAANTANRKRMVLNNAMEYACELGELTENPFKLVRWTKPRSLSSVDPRVVVNADQARRFLAAVGAHSERGQRLKAFFACMYYAGLRPEEVAALRRFNLKLPRGRADEWGELRLTSSNPGQVAAGPTTAELVSTAP